MAGTFSKAHYDISNGILSRPSLLMLKEMKGGQLKDEQPGKQRIVIVNYKLPLYQSPTGTLPTRNHLIILHVIFFFMFKFTLFVGFESFGFHSN